MEPRGLPTPAAAAKPDSLRRFPFQFCGEYTRFEASDPNNRSSRLGDVSLALTALMTTVSVSFSLSLAHPSSSSSSCAAAAGAAFNVSTASRALAMARPASLADLAAFLALAAASGEPLGDLGGITASLASALDFLVASLTARAAADATPHVILATGETHRAVLPPTLPSARIGDTRVHTGSLVHHLVTLRNPSSQCSIATPRLSKARTTTARIGDPLKYPSGRCGSRRSAMTRLAGSSSPSNPSSWVSIRPIISSMSSSLTTLTCRSASAARLRRPHFQSKEFPIDSSHKESLSSASGLRSWPAASSLCHLRSNSFAEGMGSDDTDSPPSPPALGEVLGDRAFYFVTCFPGCSKHDVTQIAHTEIKISV